MKRSLDEPKSLDQNYLKVITLVLQFIVFIMGIVYIIAIFMEYILNNKYDIIPILPILSVIVVIPVWLSGTVGLKSFSSDVGFYLFSENNFGLLQIAVQLAMVVYLIGFVRALYTMSLLDNGNWWGVSNYDKIHKSTALGYRVLELILRAFIGIVFTIHQSSINKLPYLDIFESDTDYLVPNTVFSIGATFGYESTMMTNINFFDLYEKLWLSVSLTGFIVYTLILIWTLLVARNIKVYLISNDRISLKEKNKTSQKLKKYTSIQVWAFFTGIIVSFWIMLFSQINTSFFENWEFFTKKYIIESVAFLGIIASLLMFIFVYIPQFLSIVRNIKNRIINSIKGTK